jgi:hypothetical protein
MVERVAADDIVDDFASEETGLKETAAQERERKKRVDWGYTLIVEVDTAAVVIVVVDTVAVVIVVVGEMDH